MSLLFNQLLQRKYDIQGQQANAQTTAAKAGMMGAQTERMGMPSLIGQREAVTAGQTINNQFAPDLFRAEIAGEAASTRQTNAQARGIEMDNSISPALNRGLLGGMFSTGGGTTGAQPQQIGSRFRFGLGGQQSPSPRSAGGGFGALNMGEQGLLRR